jgi:hypothetical protein
VDAKWITALLLAFVLGLTLLVFSLVQMTAEDPAIGALSLTMALVFSPGGLDDETEIAQIRQELNADPQASLQPVPGLRITIRAADIAGLSAREARLYFFRQVAEPFYRQGAAGLMSLADTPEMRASLGQGMGPFTLFTLATHRTLQRILLGLVVVCLVMLIPLIFFSYRFGRLGSPGCVLFVASVPGAVLFTFVVSALQPGGAPPQSQELGDMAGYVAAQVLPPLVIIALRNHLVSLVGGAILMAAAIAGNGVWRLTSKKRRTPATGKPSPPPAASNPD